MIFEGIIVILLSLFFWVFTVICLNGCSWILISGYSMASKEEKEMYKKRYDVVAMNRYIGKTVLLPSAVFCTVLIPIIFLQELISEQLIGVFIGTSSIAITVLCFYAAIKVLSGEKFKR